MNDAYKNNLSKVFDIMKQGLLLEPWDKAIFIATITDNDSISYDLNLYNSDNIKRRYFYDDLFKISEILILIKHQYKQKCNKLIFTLFQDGNFETEFLWDNDLYIENEYSLARSSVTILYDRFYQILHFEVLKEKDWTTTNLICSIIGEKTIIKCDVFKDEKVENFPIVLPEKWENYLLEFYKKTNEGVLKGKWKKWNKFKMQLKQGEYFDFDKDVEFIFDNDI